MKKSLFYKNVILETYYILLLLFTKQKYRQYVTVYVLLTNSEGHALKAFKNKMYM